MKKISSKLNGVKLLSEFQGTLILTVKDESSQSNNSDISSSKNLSQKSEKSGDITSNSEISESEAEEISTKQVDHGNKLSSIFRTMSQLILEKSEKFADGLDDNKPIVKDWSISLGSLEDVFLNVVRSYRENNVEKLVF